jgi:hypothetical protein
MLQTAFVLPQTSALSKGFFRFSVIWLENSKRFGGSTQFKLMGAKEKPPAIPDRRKNRPAANLGWAKG